jgi:VWFA-related protein
VDVVVTDDDEFVSDLGPADFAIYEDGELQQILQVQLVDLIAGRVQTVGAEIPGSAGERTAPPLPVPATTESSEPEGAEPDSVDSAIEPGDYGAMVFVIQGGRLGYWQRRRFAKAWVELLEETGDYTFPRAVFAIGYRGQLMQLTPLTYDVDQLRKVSTQFLDAVYGRESTFGTEIIDDEVRDPALVEDPETSRTDGASVVPGRAAALSFSYLDFVFDNDVGAVETLEALERICDSLYDRPGRKAIVWVSEGVLLTQTGRSEDALDSLQRAANSSRVSIYSVDPSLVTQRSMGGADLFGRDPIADADRARRQALGYTSRGLSNDDFRDSLVAAANETGGKAYTYNPRVERVLRDIERDSSRFYLLTYRPPRNEGDDRYHDIRVEVRRPGVDVRARKGYIHRSSVEQQVFLTASGAQLTELPVVAGAFYRWDEDGKPRVQIGVDIDRVEKALGRGGGRVPATQDEQPIFQVYFGAVDEVGGSVGRVRDRVTRRVPPPPNEPSVYLRQWEIGYGKFSFYVMVFDELTGRQGRTWFRVEIPRPVTSWRASQPILVRENMGRAFDPVLDGKAEEGTLLQVYLEIFSAYQPVLWAEVVSEDGRSAVPQFSGEIVPDELSGIARSFLNLPTSLPPGSYTIRLSISDLLVQGAANFDVSLEIVPRQQ